MLEKFAFEESEQKTENLTKMEHYLTAATIFCDVTNDRFPGHGMGM
jgi:hypothetical protein